VAQVVVPLAVKNYTQSTNNKGFWGGTTKELIILANNRIWLRLPDDNPIWDIPSELRSQVADQWLRQGAGTQDFAELVDKLGVYVSQLGQHGQPMAVIKPDVVEQPEQLPVDKAKIAQSLIKGFDLFA